MRNNGKVATSIDFLEGGRMIFYEGGHVDFFGGGVKACWAGWSSTP